MKSMARMTLFQQGMGVSVLALALTGLPAVAAPLLVNGDFETGDFSGWTVADQAGGNFGTFFIDTAVGFTPLTSQGSVGPAAGQYYAVSDQVGEGASVLYQAFTLAAGSYLKVRFDLFVNDYSADVGGSPSVNAAGLDFTAVPNQHARVDILLGSADPFDTGAGVLYNLYLGTDAGTYPHDYTNYDVDIASPLAAGTYLIRFATAQNVFFLNAGIDNVALDAQPVGSGVPEPHGLALLGLGLGMIAFGRARKARR